MINLLTKGSLRHVTEQLRKTPQAHIDDIKRAIDLAHKKKISVNLYLEDWSNGMKNSPSYVFDMVDALCGEGVNRFMLPDTLGILNPLQTADFCSQMVKRYPNLKFDFHAHNEFCDIVEVQNFLGGHTVVFGKHFNRHALGNCVKHIADFFGNNKRLCNLCIRDFDFLAHSQFAYTIIEQNVRYRHTIVFCNQFNGRTLGNCVNLIRCGRDYDAISVLIDRVAIPITDRIRCNSTLIFSPVGRECDILALRCLYGQRDAFIFANLSCAASAATCVDNTIAIFRSTAVGQGHGVQVFCCQRAGIGNSGLVRTCSDV